MSQWKEFQEWKAKQGEESEPLEDTKIHQLSKPTVGKKHKWIQRGTHICCDLCESAHGFYVNVEDIMTGIDEQGMPIISKKY